MSSLTDYLERALLDHVLGGAPYTPPATIHAGLLTTPPTDDTPGLEVEAADYARQPVVFGATASAPDGRTIKSNNATVTFESTTLWGTIFAVGFYDAATGGNLLAYDDRVTPFTIDEFDSKPFPAGTMTWRLT